GPAGWPSPPGAGGGRSRTGRACRRGPPRGCRGHGGRGPPRRARWGRRACPPARRRSVELPLALQLGKDLPDPLRVLEAAVELEPELGDGAGREGPRRLRPQEPRGAP